MTDHENDPFLPYRALFHIIDDAEVNAVMRYAAEMLKYDLVSVYDGGVLDFGRERVMLLRLRAR